MNDYNVNDYSYLIIGGVTKAGTTSLFTYLGDHPEICPSSLKETCFFLDADYPRTAQYRLEDDGLEKYGVYFEHCQGRCLRLEATPVYLYSSRTPQKIKRSLQDVKIVFILREPIERLISFYRFEKQGNVLPSSLSFDEYVHLLFQKESKCDQKAVRPPYMRALEEGRYSTYLESYFDVFERDRLCVLQSEKLKQDPATLLEDVCVFAGIDPSFYRDYDFQVFHRTPEVKSTTIHGAYLRFRKNIRAYAHNKPWFRVIARSIQRLWEPIYFRLNRGHRQDIAISEKNQSLLNAYYSDETKALAQLLGEKHFSWR